MKIGLGAPVSGAWATPDTLTNVAVRAEELGYDELWTFQRLLVGTEDHLDPVYQSVLDPLLPLSFAAARTTRIRLGVALVNLPFISPVHLAKQAATLDVLSGGRFDLGLGTGWSRTEFTATGADKARRGHRAEEFVKVLHTLWHDDPASFEGEFYTIPPSRMRPRPVQPGGPPILLGGVVKPALQRAGRVAAGWMSRSATDLDHIADDIAVVKNAAPDPDRTRIVVRGVVRPGPRDGRLTGTYDEIRADADWLGEQGVTDLYYDLNWHDRIGNPDVPLEEATEQAMTIIEALRP
ncbi:LLM class flavin-dependent oxidoreductase [Actinophytocola algeriensis]|uniref:Putative F420-dependent oxidoreductase n=1 Tax=Actinophytocola algeriensis TaxID=1768010 RepID=A0A7W7Q9V3_9PSEU|nr:TIGR03619 family F420-dependent LLM class oxidoreductase [Actinophytocola algeriensis]MBB4909710.1 putative F420-dependent oxidoreductase [Actinophytocola algeriensis]MBE1475700.1 putative F420-dependent oxidoreductase [Actinophytocola algeriensis]